MTSRLPTQGSRRWLKSKVCLFGLTCGLVGYGCFSNIGAKSKYMFFREACQILSYRMPRETAVITTEFSKLNFVVLCYSLA